MVNLIFWTILIIIVATFLLERWLDLINMKHTVAELPAALQGIFDKEEYKKSQLYKKENTRFSFISGSFSLVLMVVAIAFGLFGWLDGTLSARTESYYIIVLLFFGIIGLVSDLLSIPFDLYDTFIIEEKYGFNRTTRKTFILDKLKGWLITILIGGGILFLITWFYQKTGDYFWLLAWGLVTVFSLFMGMFYSNLIVPLFNKQKPLEEGELKSSIEKFADTTGYHLKNIYVIDGSKRSSKANAYFTGLGPKKRIVLYDTLINDLETEEIVAVLAHEIGHFKKKHTLLGMILGILQTGLMLFLFSLFVSRAEFSQALGGAEASFHLGLIAFGIIYSPFQLFVSIFMNMVSRKNEYQADSYAKEHVGATPLIAGLKKLSKKNLSNLTPHPLYVFFHYSHPTLLQRIEAMTEKKGR
jgi:STE24 endopeptidase